jgi:hypothetical protein
MRPLSLFVLAAAAMLGTPGAGAGQPSPPPDAIRGKKADVFSRPEFQAKKPSEPSWLFRQFLAFLEWLGSLREVAPLLFWAIVLGCVAMLVGLIALIVYQLRAVFAFGGRNRSASPDHAAQRIRLSVACREESDRRAAQGDYTEAVRYLFLSLVYRLDERGRVGFHKDYTNREYLELVADRLHVRDALRVIVDLLDDHWYAQQPCARSQYDECLEVYNRLAGA